MWCDSWAYQKRILRSMGQQSSGRLRICKRLLQTKTTSQTLPLSVAYDQQCTVGQHPERRVEDSQYQNHPLGMDTLSTRQRDRRVHTCGDRPFPPYRTGTTRWIEGPRRRRRWGKGGAFSGSSRGDIALLICICIGRWWSFDWDWVNGTWDVAYRFCFLEAARSALYDDSITIMSINARIRSHSQKYMYSHRSLESASLSLTLLCLPTLLILPCTLAISENTHVPPH